MGWHKFNAKRTVVNGQSFPSMLEANVYCELLLRVKAGELKSVERHPSFQLTRMVSYKCDFKVVTNEDLEIAVEAKGVVTDRWRLVQALWEEFGTMPLQVWVASKKKHGRPYLAKTILPLRGDHDEDA